MDAELRLSRRFLAGLLAGLAVASPALASGAPEKDKKKGGGLSFIQFPTLTATVAAPRGRRAVMTIETGVDVKDEKLREFAALSEPRLRAAYTQTLQVYAAGLAPNELPNAEYISRVLQRDTDRVLGKPGAKLLLGTILIN